MAANDEKLITLSNLEQFKQDLDPYLVHNLFTLTTVAGNANSGNYLSVRWYVSGVDGITEPYDGMKIAIKIPLAGVGTAGAMLSINGNNANDYHPLAYNNNSVLTTHFAVNSIKIFTYVANQSMTCYKTKNTSSSVTGIWKAEGDYDSNTTITYGTIAYYFRPYAAESIYRYKLVMLDKDNRLVPLVTNEFPVQILVNNVATHTTIYSDWASSTNYAKDVVVHRVVNSASKWYKSLQASNKNHTPESSATWWTEITQNSTPTTHAFRPDKIYWYNTTTTIASGAAVGGNTLMSNGYNQPSLAYYNFNDGLLAYRVFYLCGTYDKNTGLFTLRDAGVVGSKNYYTILPTNSSNITLSNYFTNGYDYILVGGTYSSNNYVHLREDHPMYHFDGTNLVPYDTWLTNTSTPVEEYFNMDFDADDMISPTIGNNIYYGSYDLSQTEYENLLDKKNIKGHLGFNSTMLLDTKFKLTDYREYISDESFSGTDPNTGDPIYTQWIKQYTYIGSSVENFEYANLTCDAKIEIKLTYSGSWNGCAEGEYLSNYTAPDFTYNNNRAFISVSYNAGLDLLVSNQSALKNPNDNSESYYLDELIKLAYQNGKAEAIYDYITIPGYITHLDMVFANSSAISSSMPYAQIQFLPAVMGVNHTFPVFHGTLLLGDFLVDESVQSINKSSSYDIYIQSFGDATSIDYQKIIILKHLSNDDLLDTKVRLEEDLYVYTNVGRITATAEQPTQVGSVGDSIRDVFNTLFVGEDENPKVLIPTLSVALAANGGQTYPLVRGEIIAPKYKITYGNVDGSYQYKSLENRNSTSTGVTVSSSSFTIGGTAITPSATISNSTTTTILTSPVNITVKSNGSSQTIAGTVTLNLGNVKTAATKLGKKATAVGSNSTGTLDSSTGKLSSSTVTLSQSVSVTSSTPLSVTKPSGAISLSTTSGGTCEVGETKTFTATITANNTKGSYPFGYFTNNTYVSTTNDAGCALTGLTLKKGSSNITTSTNDNGVAQTITHVITEGSNSITISGSLTFSCDTTRIPATENHNETDTSEYDYRINGSTATYSPSIAPKIWSATGKYYNYYTLGTSTTPTIGTKISNGTQIDNIDTSYGQYLYFFSTSNSYTKIQQYDNPIWNDMTTTKLPNTITLTLASGGTGTYYVYRSDALNNMTGQTFRLA